MTSPQESFGLIIPALNEADSIGVLLRQLPPLFAQIVVVDNGSEIGRAHV